MDAVLLALSSAVCFGAMTVALRLALRRMPDAELGAVATAGSGLLVVLAAAIAFPRGELEWGQLALFAVAGLLAPGMSQLLFTLAVRDAGASRTSVVVGTAPLVAVVIALAVLDEPLRLPLLLGAALIVAGGIALVGERVRPGDFRAIGMLFALACTVLFATRDSYIRWASLDTALPSTAAAAATLGSGLAFMLLYVLATRRRRVRLARPRALLPFVPVGAFFGLSYIALFEAYYRGRVSVVAPIVATESLFAVLLSALLLRRSELVGPRLLAGALLIVAGGVLIGVYR